jgi:hypothetical protein
MGSAQVLISGEIFHTLVTQKIGLKKKIQFKKNLLKIWKNSPNF